MIKKVLFLLFLITSIVQLDSLSDVLVRIDADDIIKLPKSIIEGCNFRFAGQDFVIVQGKEALIFDNLPHIKVLDTVQANYNYYLVMAGKEHDKLKGLGRIVDTFDGTVLLRIPNSAESDLISLGLPFMSLPERYSIGHEHLRAPELVFPERSSSVIVDDIAKAVNQQNLRNFVFDLQENRNLLPPFNLFRSRYCLRVKETDDPSDEACDNASQYIYNKFSEYGLEVEFDQFEHTVLMQGHYKLRNVIATLRGKGENSRKIFILSSHYDSVASKTPNWNSEWKTLPAPGANDNASGTAAVLEIARVLSKYDFDYTIKFITFSGEELGLHGSKHFAKLSAEKGYEIIGVLNLDMIAYDVDLPDIDIITDRYSEWLADTMLAVQSRLGIRSLTLKKIVNANMVYSDHSPFWQNGYNAILCIDNSDFDSPEFYPFMHTANDTMDKLNFEMFTNLVRVVAATLGSLAVPIGHGPYPDLYVSAQDIYLSTEHPLYGQTFQLECLVHNIGRAAAKNTTVRIWIEDPFYKKASIVSEQSFDIAPGRSVTVQADLNIKGWGEHKIFVKANPDAKIFETDGSNNIAYMTVNIGSKPPQLGLMKVYPNPAKLKGDESVHIAYTLSSDASTRLSIYDLSGNIVYEKIFIKGGPGGKFGYNDGLKWDGKNMKGVDVASGLYIVCVTVSGNAGEVRSISKKLYVIR